METVTLEQQWHDTADELGITTEVKAKVERTLLKLDKHDKATADHSRRVGIYAARIAVHQGLDGKLAFHGGSLHDRGKLSVPRALLTKQGIWTPEDAAALRHHPMAGYRATLREGLVYTAGIVARHHTFQPNGYPAEPPAVPPNFIGDFQKHARIVALADYYDASHRPDADGVVASGEQVKAKVLGHNPDVRTLIGELYEQGIFSAEH